MNIDLAHLIIALLVFLGGCIGVALRVGFVVSGLVDTIRKEFNARLELIAAEMDGKVGRVYQRFDEYKAHMEDNFIRKEMCSIVHNGTGATLIELSKKVDVLGDKLDALTIKVAGMK